MSNTRSIAIVGVGGQGTVLTSDILIEGLVDLGFDVKKTEQHGLSQRGGSVNCMVKYGDAVYAPIMPTARPTWWWPLRRSRPCAG